MINLYKPVRKIIGNGAVNGTANVGSSDMRNPMGMVMDANTDFMYVSEFGGAKVVKIDIELGLTVQEYTLPDGIRGYGAWSIGLIDGGETLLRCNDRQQLIAQNISDGTVKWIKDASKDEFSFRHSGNWSYGNFLELANGNYVMSDWNNNVCVFDSDVSNVTVQYVPSVVGDELTLLLEEFEAIKLWGVPYNTVADTRNFVLTVPLRQVPKVGDILVELRRK